jgi:hypothetical protein
MNRSAAGKIATRRGPILVAVLLGYQAALPAQESAPAPPATIIRTQQPAAVPASPAGQLQVRVFEGFGTLGPVYGARDTPLAVDVGIGLATCPDGNTEISAINIGGWRYDVAGTCNAVANRGAIRVEGATAEPLGAEPAPAATGNPGVIRCDPATWRCSRAP